MRSSCCPMRPRPHRPQIAEFAAKNRLPAIYNAMEFVEAGGLDELRGKHSRFVPRAATYVDKILKGANPADLPVEQPKSMNL